MVWFTSDTHLGHRNIIKYCNRPFESVEEMNERLINNINEKIAPKDILYHLGDFCMGDMKAYREKINCNRIFLIKGNHDKQIDYKLKLFEGVYDLKDIVYYNRTFVLCHYSMRVWNKKHHGAIHLYGHSHNTIDNYDLSMDVGVDAMNYYPITAYEIIKKMEMLKNGE